MSAQSPGSRVVPKESSDLSVRPLDDPGTQQGLAALLGVFQSAFGPKGRVHLVHNDTGGHVTATSSSIRLLQTMSVSMPVLRLVTSAVQGHQRLFSDAGGFAALLSLKLIHRFTNLENIIHRRLVTEVQELLLNLAVEYLQSEDCLCKTKIEFSNLSKAVKLVENIIVSKPGCLLFGRDLSHICGLVVDGFLRTFSSNNREAHQVMYKTVEGLPVGDSKVWDGVLFETPQIPTYRSSPLVLNHSIHGDTECINVVMVKVSMAGDSQEFLDVTYESSLPSAAFSDAVVAQMMAFAERLTARGDVGLLACQKVVHPKLKKFLKLNDILVLDRLGLVAFTALSQTTGSTSISSFHEVLADHHYGHLQSATHVVINSKSYLHLQGLSGRGGAVCTMVLCHQSEQALEELKSTCQVAQHMLQLYSCEPQGLMGGGCWQTTLAHHIHTQVGRHVDAWSEELCCSKLHIVEVAAVFTRCLEEIAQNLDRDRLGYHVTDLANHHHFLLPHDQQEGADWLRCQCGAVRYDSVESMKYRFLATDKEDNVPLDGATRDKTSALTLNPESCDVVDVFLPCMNAFRTAVSVANMVLGVHAAIIDTN